MALDWNNEAMARGLACYRKGEFFQAHEHWEAVWLALTEPEKTFLQSLIQVSAAFHHLHSGNARGAASLLSRALARLDRYPADFAGVNVAGLRAGIREWLQALTDGSDLPAEVPRIR